MLINKYQEKINRRLVIYKKWASVAFRGSYDQTIPGSLITLSPTDLQIADNNYEDIPGGELYFVNEANFTCTVAFNPDPPQPYTSLTVTATY